jgi:hypothetical protein
MVQWLARLAVVPKEVVRIHLSIRNLLSGVLITEKCGFGRCRKMPIMLALVCVVSRAVTQMGA